MIALSLKKAAEAIDATLSGSDAQFFGCGIDSRTVSAGNLFIAIPGERFDGHDFVDSAAEQGALAALVSQARKFSLPTLLVDDTIAALAKLAGFWRSKFPVPLTAITGSNGKTTVKEMLASILKLSHRVLATEGNLNNEIGAPLTLLQLGERHDQIVLELGANHPGEIARLTRMSRPSVAVITLCAPAHLEGFGTPEGVARAKGELIEEMPADGCVVINADDAFAPLWQKMADNRRCIRFAMAAEAEVKGEWRASGSGGEIRMRTPLGALEARLALSGRHNGANALAATAAALAAGASLEDIRAGLEAAKPVSGRLQNRRAVNGATVIDDTYNANPNSLKAALEVLADCQSARWLVLGDMAELGHDADRYHRDAADDARRLGVDRIFTVGELSRITAERFGDGANHYDSQPELIEALNAELTKNATVLVKGSRSMAMERVVSALTAGR